MDVSLLHQVFRHLLDKIIEKATLGLKAAGHLDAKERISLNKRRNQIFGTGNRDYKQTNQAGVKKTVAYAIHLWLEARYPENTWIQHFNLPRGVDARKLQKAYSDFLGIDETLRQKSAQPVILLPENYLQLYLEFINADGLEGLLRDSRLTRDLQEKQLQLLPLPQAEAPKLAPPEVLFYHGHFLDIDQPGGNQVLKSFQAIFQIDGTTTTVKFRNTPTGDVYNGDVKIKGQGKKALVTAMSSDESFARPIAITLSHNCNCRFRDLEICVGFYIIITRDSACNRGAILFEKTNGLESTSKLDRRLIRSFLEAHGDSITNGGYRKRQDFEAELRAYQLQAEKLAFIEKFDGRCFQAVLLSKKGRWDSRHEQFNRVELSYFRFGPGNKLTCKSAYPTDIITYEGHVDFYPPYKAIAYLHPLFQGQYQIVMDLHQEEGQNYINGVYSGITQDGNLAAGRVRLISIDEAQYEKAEPHICEIHSEEARMLFEKYTGLQDFFAGNLDNHLDNTTIFYENPGMLNPSRSDLLETLPGTFYYYRTRTIKGHAREVKRYPLLIEPNGNISVHIKADGEEFTAVGSAIRKHNRVYMHLTKKDKYDGLAILIPNWRRLGKVGEVIKAVYASTSKSGHLMAGRMYLLRLSNECDGQLFQRLMPDNIDIGQIHARRDIRLEEAAIIENLCGQLNNYIAVRHFNEDVPYFLGQRLFESACFQAQQNNIEDAFDTLLIALMRGGFRDIPVLKKALASDGPLAPVWPLLKEAPGLFDITQNHGEDQRDYLQGIIDELESFQF